MKKFLLLDIINSSPLYTLFRNEILANQRVPVLGEALHALIR